MSECNDNDEVWDEWDAALIESKQEKVREEDSAGEMTVEECKRKRKRKVKETLKTRGRGGALSAHKALQIGLWSVAMKKGKNRVQVERIAKAVAAFTLNAMTFVGWHRLKKLLLPEVYESLWKNLFGCFAKFVLSIFDVEDFERVYNIATIIRKCDKFYKLLKEVESGDGPLIPILDGRVDVKMFSSLREHDVGEILEDYPDYSKYNRYQGSVWLFIIHPVELKNITQSDIDRARDEMKKYVPLKEDRKMQLILELTHEKSYRVLDTLFVEAWKGIKFKELQKYFDTTFDDENPSNIEDLKCPWLHRDMKPPEVAEVELRKFVHSVRSGLVVLAGFKESALQHFQEVVTVPLSCGILGDFADEVLQVIRIADHERRMQGQRFISVQNILFGLSLSRVSDYARKIVDDKQLKCLGPPPKSPIYYLYKVAGHAASDLGAKLVRLEHLVLAIKIVIEGSKMERGNITHPANDDNKRIAEILKGEKQHVNLPLGLLRLIHDNEWIVEMLKDLTNVETNGGVKKGVKSWKDDELNDNGLMLLPKECFDGVRLTCRNRAAVEELIDAFERGLTFPEIRVTLDRRRIIGTSHPRQI